MKLKSILLVVTFFLFTGMSIGQRGHSRGRSSSHVSSRSNSSAKTVHVRSYTKKNGTHVSSYNRRPPKRH